MTNQLVTILILVIVIFGALIALGYAYNGVAKEKDCLKNVAQNWTVQRNLSLVSVDANMFEVMDQERRQNWLIQFSKEEQEGCKQ